MNEIVTYIYLLLVLLLCVIMFTTTTSCACYQFYNLYKFSILLLFTCKVNFSSFSALFSGVERKSFRHKI